MSVPLLRIDPRVGRSILARRFSSVDLPEPEGPISATYSPASMAIDIRSRTGISSASRLYDLVTSRSSMSAMWLLSLYANRAAVGQRGRRVEDERLAWRHTAGHLDLIETFPPE